jgi:uncharacterized protein YaaQ
MKLIIAIVRDSVNEAVSNGLTSANFRVTYVASTGGFLRRGNSTLLIGLEDEKLEQALQIIRENCGETTGTGEKRAVIFVLKVDQYVHF